jgi:hypothetical protein
MDAWTPGTKDQKEKLFLMLRRLFRVAIASSLAKAWLQKSPRWLGIAGAVALLRALDARASKSGRRVKNVRPSE